MCDANIVDTKIICLQARMSSTNSNGSVFLGTKDNV
ncbi:hypothetical protein DERF_014543 [Dermatophagoides farinae]|uniref:Uncharacterized protein n=1 Tax=Dermatophagoides farinae TaxID=6954 RepID=A0A922HMK6_DERFA|nr:hypothetical protein DERF_014543 [Dermatophagoides farinae]